jgi:hypothetical protein
LLHQVGHLFELNVKLRCQKVKWELISANYSCISHRQAVISNLFVSSSIFQPSMPTEESIVRSGWSAYGVSYIRVYEYKKSSHTIMFRGTNPGGGEIFRTCLDRPWGPPSLLYNGYRVFPEGKKRSGRDDSLTSF